MIPNFLSGHINTLRPMVSSWARPVLLPRARTLETEVSDTVRGTVRLRAPFHDLCKDDSLLILLHGLGGNCDSHYVLASTRVALDERMSCLRMNLRGADGSGEDYYHAGLTADLRAILANPALDGFAHVVLMGFSMGGHIVLRYLSEDDLDPRVRAAMAICPPLDLARCATEIDRAPRTPYRRYLLTGLKRTYAEVARRRDVPISIEASRRIRTLREWDDRVVAPRHGFRNVDDYWARASVAPRLGNIRLPTMIVAGDADPMVLATTLRPALSQEHALQVVWLQGGGHVGFARGASLGPEFQGSLEAQTLAWLRSHIPPR